MESTLAQIDATVAQIAGKFNEIPAKVNAVLAQSSSVPEGILSTIRELWDSLVEKMQEFFANLADMQHGDGDYEAMKDAQEKWLSDVAMPMSEAFENSELGNLAVDNWDGEAADKYEERIPGQRSAMNSVKEMAKDISTGFSKMCVGIANYRAEMLAAVGVLLLGIILAIVSIAGLITIPAGLAAIITALVTATYLIAKAATNFAGQANSAKLEMDKALVSGVKNWPEFVV